MKEEHLQFFKEKNYKQAIETNGTRTGSSLIDYIACSPKKKYESIADHLPEVDEIRLPVKKGDTIPDISVFPKAKKYFLSPLFDGDKINKENIDYAVKYTEENPQWILSLQIHKLIGIE